MLLAVFLLLSTASAKSTPPAKNRKTRLTLNWTSNIGRYSYPHAILTDHCVVLQSNSLAGFVSLDRTTGKERYRQTPAASAPSWGLIVPTGTGDIFVVSVGDTRVQAIDSLTGKVLWSSPDETVLLTACGGLVAVAGKNGEDVVWYEASTGQVVLPNTSKGKARLHQAAASKMRLSPGFTQEVVNTPVGFLDFETGYFTRLGWGGIENALVMDHLISYVSCDNGMVGASGFPKFVMAYDKKGKSLWQFPEKIPTNDIGIAAPGTQIRSMTVLPVAKIVVVTKDGYPGLIGLRVEDGSIQWRQSPANYSVLRTIAEPNGLWLLGDLIDKQAKDYPSGIAYLDGLTGAFHQLARLSYSNTIAVDERSVVAVGLDGTVHCYRRNDIGR